MDLDLETMMPLSRERKRKRGTDDVSQQRVVAAAAEGEEVKRGDLMGRYVLKEFDGSGVYLGKIVEWESELYRVEYEDADFEDMDGAEVAGCLVGEEYFDEDLRRRRARLDDMVANKGVEKENVVAVAPMLDKELVKGGDEVGLVCDIGVDEKEGVGGGVRGETYDDSCSDSCEYDDECKVGIEGGVAGVIPPELPPSSGTIAVPEEYVPNLLSVYGFLRSFSVKLFLAPFTLDDLVGCLNCAVPSSLLDAIHVALLRAVRKYLEAESSGGSERASKCLRSMDWVLLDTLTWPVYLVHYLALMGYLYGNERKGFCINVLEKPYCSLSVGKKLKVLQILCDGALESAEVRAEIDIREESEIGIDADGLASLSENGPRRVHHRNPKTSAGMISHVVDDCLHSNGTVPPYSTESTLGRIVHVRDGTVIEQDGNVDECRLCGMDGTLLCCDGCPSAYHSRCIGVSRSHLPKGSWFCPECKLSKIGPTINVGTSLQGAELFGIDPFEYVFLGTCEHLLVMKGSENTFQFVRYYSSHDIPKVLGALQSSEWHCISYSRISQGICKYWGMLRAAFPISETVPRNMGLQSIKEEVRALTLVSPQNSSHRVYEEVEKFVGEYIGGEYSIDGPSMTKFGPSEPSTGSSKQPCRQDVSRANTTAKLSEQTAIDSSSASSSITQGSGLSGLTHQVVRVGSMLKELSAGTSDGMDARGQRYGACFPANDVRYVEQGANGFDVGGHHRSRPYMGSSFKPHAYINHYIHGDVAVSAAASLAVLSSEENQKFEAHLSGNPKKVVSTCVSIQAKAFCLAAVRFFWPNPEKRLLEFSRDRCSWCINCRATSKKVCLLNSAALNATKGAMKIFSKLSLAKNVENSLYGICIYMLYMEEALHGLVVGPFLDGSHRQEWRKQVEQISSYSGIRSLLLKLEKNIRTIALSGEWVKPLDDVMSEPSPTQNTCPAELSQKRPGRPKKHSNASEIIEDVQKKETDFLWWRGGKLSKIVLQKGMLSRALLRKNARQGGSRKIPGIFYSEGPNVPQRSRQFIWRVAVEMSKNISHIALQIRYLDHHIRWSDLTPPEQSQDPKASDTEASTFRNASICDKKHVDNKLMYGVVFEHQRHLPSRLMKSIMGKEETQDAKQMYWFLEARVPLYLIKDYEKAAGLTDSLPIKDPPCTLSKLQQKQLKASRKDIFLYLVRKRDNLAMCSCASCRCGVFLSNSVKCNACEGELLPFFADACCDTPCYCHRECTMSSIIQTNEDVKFVITCKNCYQNRVTPQNHVTAESPTSPLTMQGQEYQKPSAVYKSAVPNKSHQQTSSPGILENSETKSAGPDSFVTTKSQKKKSSTTWGLVWRKKQDTGTEFRRNHVLLRAETHDGSIAPVCHLCQKPYNPQLMYIHCEVCQNWFHADAVKLDESKLGDLVGFKCLKCRRSKLPVCPYADSVPKKAETKKSRTKGSSQSTGISDSVSGSISEYTESSIPATPISPMEDEFFIQIDDPILFFTSDVEPVHDQIAEPNPEWDAPSGPEKITEAGPEWDAPSVPEQMIGADLQWNDPSVPEQRAEAELDWGAPPVPSPQKLSVRRYLKNEQDDGMSGIEAAPQAGFSESNNFISAANNIVSHDHEWDISGSGFENGLTLDHENFNFENYEPHTFFSFGELLEADAGQSHFVNEVQLMPSDYEYWDPSNSMIAFQQQSELGTSHEHMGPVELHEAGTSSVRLEPFPSATNAACEVCSLTAPAPDLACPYCKLHIHSHCSSWGDIPRDEIWLCGNCRPFCAFTSVLWPGAVRCLPGLWPSWGVGSNGGYWKKCSSASCTDFIGAVCIENSSLMISMLYKLPFE
ncbi:DDT domain-containing protein [Drosera capensis]